MRKSVALEFPGQTSDTIEIATVTAEQAYLIQADEDETVDAKTRQIAANARLVHASIVAAGGKMGLEDVLALPYYKAYVPLQAATLEVNGFTTVKKTAGETEGNGQPKTPDAVSDTHGA